MARLQRLFRILLESLRKQNPIAADIIGFGIISSVFLVYIDKVCHDEAILMGTQHTFMLKKIEKNVPNTPPALPL